MDNCEGMVVGAGKLGYRLAELMDNEERCNFVRCKFQSIRKDKQSIRCIN